MKKVIKISKLFLTNTCMTALALSIAVVESWGPGCSLLFYEPKKPEGLDTLNLRELRKSLK
jgi:cyclic lactone autoinducer peptide